jgi:hypothetical protein
MNRLISTVVLLAMFVVSDSASAQLLGTSFGYAIQDDGTACGLESTDPARADVSNTVQVPMFRPYNRNSMQWWYNLVEEAAFANLHYLAINFRGDSPCGHFPPNGNEPTFYAGYLRQPSTSAGMRRSSRSRFSTIRPHTPVTVPTAELRQSSILRIPRYGNPISSTTNGSRILIRSQTHTG